MEILPMERYPAYLTDESRQSGFADGIVFPESTEELCGAMRLAAERGLAVTLQGSRTGLSGGAVPHGGLVVSLERMNRVHEVFERDGGRFLRVQAGAALSEIEKKAQAAGRFFPPDPTEKNAAVGGVFASRAQGLSTPRYGEATRYIEALTLVSGEGKILETGGGALPPGFSGAVAELTLRLLPLPKHVWGIMLFFSDFKAFSSCLSDLRYLWESGFPLACAEFFDGTSLRIISEEREQNSLLKWMPDFPALSSSALYVELHSGDEAAMDNALTRLLDAFSGSGGKEESTWAESNPPGIRRFRDMRHALVEIAGDRMGFDAIRVRTEADIHGPAEGGIEYIGMFQGDARAAGVPCAVYGNVLQNRLRAAILYKTEAQHCAAKRLLEKWTPLGGQKK